MTEIPGPEIKAETPPPETVKENVRQKKMEHQEQSRWMDVASLATTVFAGLMGAYVAIERNFWSKVRSKGILKDAYNTREDVHDKVLRGFTIKGEPIKGKDGEAIITAAEKDYKSARMAYIKNMELNSPLRRYGYLRNHEKQEVKIAAFAAAAVTLGVVTGLASLKRTSNKQEEIEAKLGIGDTEHRL